MYSDQFVRWVLEAVFPDISNAFSQTRLIKRTKDFWKLNLICVCLSLCSKSLT